MCVAVFACFFPPFFLFSPSTTSRYSIPAWNIMVMMMMICIKCAAYPVNVGSYDIGRSPFGEECR